VYTFKVYSEPSRGLAQADLRVEHLYLPANLIEGGGGGDIAEDEPGPLLGDASASDRNFSLPQRLLYDTLVLVRRVFGGAVAVGNDDDEGVRSGDGCSEAGAVGDIRMLGNRLVDGAQGGGGGGGSIHRGWAAELKDQLPQRSTSAKINFRKDQLPLGDGLRLGEKRVFLCLLWLTGMKPSAVVAGAAVRAVGRRGWCDGTSGKGGDVLSQSLKYLRQNGVGGRSECGSSCGSRSGAGSESSDWCSQGLDLLLQRGDNFLVLALNR
jgi:hypothetical protein